jgi:hypothetical protein
VADKQDKPKVGGSTNFDFNFDSAPQEPAGASIDLDDLLSGGNNRSGSMAAKNVNIFEFDTLGSQNNNA